MNEPVFVTLLVVKVLERLDIPYLIGGPFDQQQFARRVKRVIDKDSAREVCFTSPEDTILAKLEW